MPCLVIGLDVTPTGDKGDDTALIVYTIEDRGVLGVIRMQDVRIVDWEYIYPIGS